MSRYEYEQAGSDHQGTVQRLAEAAVAYLRSRKAEHWIMFLAGLGLGAVLG